MRQYSNESHNKVVALVRDKAAAERAQPELLTRSNVHLVEADLTSYESLKVFPVFSQHSASSAETDCGP